MGKQKAMTKDDVVALMKKRQGNRTQQEFADELGLARSYIAEVYRGTRGPGEKLLEKLGLRKTPLYSQDNGSAAD